MAQANTLTAGNWQYGEVIYELRHIGRQLGNLQSEINSLLSGFQKTGTATATGTTTRRRRTTARRKPAAMAGTAAGEAVATGTGSVRRRRGRPSARRGQKTMTAGQGGIGV